jgi:hypothetical protein
VGDKPALALKENREIPIEPSRDVVRIQDRDLRRFGQPFSAHHPDVHPRNGQNAGAAVGRGGDGAHAIFDFRFSIFDFGKNGQEGHQVIRNANRTDARSSAAVWDAKCFVQI